MNNCYLSGAVPLRNVKLLFLRAFPACHELKLRATEELLIFLSFHPLLSPGGGALM